MKNKKHVITRTNRTECGAVCQNDRLSAGHIWQTRSHVYGEVKCQAEVRSDVVTPNKLDNDKTCKGLLRRFVHKITNNNEISPHNDMNNKNCNKLINLSPKKIIDSSPNALALNGYGSALMLELVRLRMTAFTLAEGATHVDLPLTKVKFAFTLAEVLITLGIIGVVAAMTIPVLFSNINNAKFRNQYKKAVSTLNQAGLTAQANYEYNFAGANALCGNDKTIAAAQNPEVTMSFCAIFNSTLKAKTYNGKVGDLQKMSNGRADGTYELKVRDVINDDYKNYLSYSLADGTLIAFDPNARNCELSIGNRITQDMFSGPVNGNDLSHCLGFIDVNGVTLPNTEVRCTSGENRVGSGSGCIVTNNAGHLADVFPIVFHDATVEPASGAAQFILDSYK